MFDTYLSSGALARSVREVHKTVHEHRAPTDQSIALVREFEKEAENKVLYGIKGSDNSFQFRAMVFREIFDEKIMLDFSLNGRKHKFTIPTERRSSAKDNLLKIRDAIAKEIANTICIESASILTK